MRVCHSRAALRLGHGRYTERAARLLLHVDVHPEINHFRRREINHGYSESYMTRPDIVGLRTDYVTLFNGNKTIYTQLQQ